MTMFSLLLYLRFFLTKTGRKMDGCVILHRAADIFKDGRAFLELLYTTNRPLTAVVHVWTDVYLGSHDTFCPRAASHTHTTPIHTLQKEYCMWDYCAWEESIVCVCVCVCVWYSREYCIRVRVLAAGLPQCVSYVIPRGAKSQIKRIIYSVFWPSCHHARSTICTLMCVRACACMCVCVCVRKIHDWSHVSRITS